MSTVEFEEEQYTRPTYYTPAAPQSGITGFLVSNHIAGSAKSAEKILIGAIVLLIVIAGIILYTNSQNSQTKVVAPPGNSIIQIQNGPPRLEKPII